MQAQAIWIMCYNAVFDLAAGTYMARTSSTPGSVSTSSTRDETKQSTDDDQYMYLESKLTDDGDRCLHVVSGAEGSSAGCVD